MAMDLEALEGQVQADQVDTVLVCIVDMQGRLMGKRFHAKAFLASGYAETHCCNYLLATDLEMATPDGYAATSWSQGYGDYVMRPDLATLREVPWLPGTAMLLCDILDHHGHEPVAHSPRRILQYQVERLAKMGYETVMATELEFFLFEQSLSELAKQGYRDLVPVSAYNEDYHILQTTKEEAVMRPLRNYLYQMGIPVEGSKGEAAAGQEELNIRYADALACAEHHTIAKHATKEIAWQQGMAASFMAKWSHDRIGSSSHVHQSLTKDGKNAFADAGKPLGKSKLLDHYLAGLIKYGGEYTFFMAPNVNSYKRFTKNSFAPTQFVWSVDNRTAAFRLCADGTEAVRIECRIPGADMNPYLALAAMLAAGAKGIEEKLPLPPAYEGNAYKGEVRDHVPGTLREASELLDKSAMLREAMGDEVIDHYVRAARWEQEEFDRVVTSWEVARGFERS